jgi:outer membrane protein OmpA-like peptidoglycan-associated protein
MLVLTDALNQLGGDNRPEVASNPKVASIDGNPTQEGGQPPTAARPHNLPGQPALEAAAFTVRPPLVQHEEFSAPSPPPEPIDDPAEAQSHEVLKVTKTATLRARPSTRAWKIGIATLGKALHVKARERNWVQFLDPSSGQIGWIHSSLVRPTSSSGAATVAASEEDLYEALTAPPLERLDRGYSLEEIRQSYDLRERMRSVDLDTINFEFGSWEVAPEYYDTLEQLAEVINRILQENPEEVFLIEAHSDAVGSEIDNLSLSDRRAEAVAIILTENFGIPAENLVTQGYGEQFLKIPTELPERENRRVSVRPIKPLMSREYSSR